MNAPERFMDLWTNYLEGELDEAGMAELKSMLSDDADLLQLATDMYQTHRLLGVIVEDSPSRRDRFINDTMSMLPKDSDTLINSVMSDINQIEETRTPSQPTLWTFVRYAGIAAMIAIAAIAWFAIQPNDHTDVPEDKSVRFASLARAEFFGELSPPIGSQLTLKREYALMNGMVEINFPRGASVIIEGPALFRVISDDCLALDTGHCSVHTPEGAEGFRVETPPTEITDLGTRFFVSVNEVGETDVQVIEGLAEIRETIATTTDTVQLSEHQARRFHGSAQSGSQSLDFNPESYRGQLPDRVISYQAKATENGFFDELESVTIQRNGRVYEIPVNELIGVNVIHFRAGENKANITVPVGYDGDRLAGLELDALLHTGVLNPGGSVEPLSESPVLEATPDTETTPGLAVEFQTPIVNRPGPDVVFFELQSVMNPQEGDACHISPLTFKDGLRSLTIERYDITLTSHEAKPLPDIDLFFFREHPTSTDDLIHGAVERRRQTLRFHALAVAIDLSDLGYAEEETVTGLFIQDALNDDHYVDPVFIGGLSPIHPAHRGDQ